VNTLTPTPPNCGGVNKDILPKDPNSEMELDVTNKVTPLTVEEVVNAGKKKAPIVINKVSSAKISKVIHDIYVPMTSKAKVVENARPHPEQ